MKKKSDKKTDGKWKGEASHFNVIVDGKENKNCCVFYKDPKPEAAEIKGYGKQNQISFLIFSKKVCFIAGGDLGIKIENS